MTTTVALAVGLGADPEVRCEVTAIAGLLGGLRRDLAPRRRCDGRLG